MDFDFFLDCRWWWNRLLSFASVGPSSIHFHNLIAKLLFTRNPKLWNRLRRPRSLNPTSWILNLYRHARSFANTPQSNSVFFPCDITAQWLTPLSWGAGRFAASHVVLSRLSSLDAFTVWSLLLSSRIWGIRSACAALPPWLPWRPVLSTYIHLSPLWPRSGLLSDSVFFYSLSSFQSILCLHLLNI